MDQKVSVALSSVAVVEPSVSTGNYNPPKWPSSQLAPVNQGAVKIIPNADSEFQNTQSPSSIVFPTPDNNRKDASTQTNDVPVSGYVTFPDKIRDKSDSEVPNQRPVEEHIIVINQADGSIKEITPGSTNPADNSIILGTNVNNVNNNVNNNNNNNPNLPQLSENLTPPAENRPSR